MFLKKNSSYLFLLCIEINNELRYVLARNAGRNLQCNDDLLRDDKL